MRYAHFFVILGSLMLATSVYASSINVTFVSSISGSGAVAVPSNVVQVTGVTLLNGGASTTTGAFDQVQLDLQASLSGTYSVYVSIYVNGAFQSTQLVSGVALNPTGTATTNTFTAITPGSSPVEVEVIATQ
ncbi:MAG: hypothetical protein JRN13_05960 [Nitrososphaerota archaeon]|nr:hypothetical protein [Nitrososphaerota archaeon]MDG6937619.1 hypothetical protein [Nitrososphaerota archaeon]MDG6954579.1 hypothetical protein [Nitrososphaerota archaeon]MDG6972859.1 hypothetical protein [Nitrososphaerota archaeon]MDG6977445.1 hypothetical protein [Nitrososphaerota archaeon]